MAKQIYAYIKYFLIIVTVWLSIDVIGEKHFARTICVFAMLIMFLFVTHLYEKKRKLLSTGYIFLLLVTFVDFILCPYYYTTEKLLEKATEATLGVVWPTDHFYLYCFVVFFVYLIIIIYLVLIKEYDYENSKFSITVTESSKVLLVSLICNLPVSLILGGPYATAYISPFCYFILAIYINAKTKTKTTGCMWIGVISGLVALVPIIRIRFIVLQYILPLGICILTIMCLKNARINRIKLFAGIGIVVFSIGIYGVISEIIKLNTYWGGSYDISDILTDSSLLTNFLYKQIYRMFGIWTHLGGNMIEYIDNSHYLYGLTYIKILAPVFGFDYISLPQISAKLILANYAQPGLLAEGYANFGIIGAILNILSVFFAAEFFFEIFLKKKTVMTLILSTVPFASVLLDGGTLNSVIVDVIFFIIAFSLSLLHKKPDEHKSRYIKNRN